MVALVPTMGNLHAGHLRLVTQARRGSGRIVVSVFVNPMQFGPGEDFERYPRTLQADALALETAGVDLLFCPPVEEIYPAGHLGSQTRVVVPAELSSQLCGVSRPGHFDGVATVVCKLLNLVGPDTALFGEKDYQQLLVIRRMVRDLNLDVEVLGVPTVREPDGLALSSRNGYLSPEERAAAPALYEVLRAMGRHLQAGERNFAELESKAAGSLREAGFEPDYMAVRRAVDLGLPDGGTPTADLRVLGAGWLGGTRLIDNLTANG
jgi:pantoate--beta-alanine ligase